MDKKKLIENIITTSKVLAPAIIAEKIYEKMFNHHIYTFSPLYFSNEDFPNLVSHRHEFRSENKNLLVGYIYKSINNKDIKGLFIFSHGYGGGGHHCYLDLINAICELGYLVFAYDMTATDESEGHNMKGFTQGMLDLNSAIKYIESLPEYQNMPLYLCGHSLGAYSVTTNIGWHPSVKGAIAFSGFNTSTSPFKYNGELYAGDKSQEFLQYVDTLEHLIFGDICKRDSLTSLKESKAKVVIVHSEDDNIIPISAGYDLYYKEFKNNKRFKFVKLLTHGHGTVYYTLQGKHYYDKIGRNFHVYCKRMERSNEDKKAYLDSQINRNIYNHLVDIKALKSYIDFITK